ATATEEQLSSIWSDILGHEKIGTKDNFFELGGHSLKATRLVSQIYKDLGVQLSLRDVFLHPEIGELGAVIDGMQQEQYARIEAVEARPYYPLSHAQKRLWILSQLEDDHSAYNITGVHEFSGRLDKSALEEAFKSMIERHEVLRTRIKSVDGEPVQQISEAGSEGFGIRYTDISELSAADKEAEIKTQYTASLQHRFDMEAGPLLRADLLTISEDRYIFILTLHHII
ncbi:condensation domain-containing protein, partial [Fulvivirga kasyanovii]|uniref:condensation domain-containing protein n=1 Tax=Fulvivirga kasyanovii TaxID=396812 RepID=UPI0031D5CB27